jgi:hypothetical protein
MLDVLYCFLFMNGIIHNVLIFVQEDVWIAAHSCFNAVPVRMPIVMNDQQHIINKVAYILFNARHVMLSVVLCIQS